MKYKQEGKRYRARVLVPIMAIMIVFGSLLSWAWNQTEQNSSVSIIEEKIKAIRSGEIAEPVAVSQSSNAENTVSSQATDPCGNVDYVSELITEDEWNELFPHRWGTPGNPDYSTQGDFYSHASFMQAVKEMANIKIKKVRRCGTNLEQVWRIDKVTGKETLITTSPGWDDPAGWGGDAYDTEEFDYGKFLNDGDLEVRKRELIAFLANTSQETTGGWPDAPGGKYVWGFYFQEEVGCENNAPTDPNYQGCRYAQFDAGGDNRYDPVDGKTYHGRGPLQISYNYNYGPASEMIYGDKNVLLNDPDKVLSSGVDAFKTAIWFWMTPQAPKPSCHDAITYKFAPTDIDLQQGRHNDFGLTILIINGGVECGSQGAEHEKAASRIGHYKRYADFYGITTDIDDSPINSTDNGCASMMGFISLDESTDCTLTPRGVITSPVNNTTLPSGQAINISCTPTDQDGDAIVKVEFYSGYFLTPSDKIGERTSAPWDMTWSNVPDGTYTIYARIYDADGDVYNSDMVAVYVGPKPTRAPEVYMVKPYNYQTYQSPANVTFEAIGEDADPYSASDPNKGIKSMEFFLDGVSIGVDDTAPFNATKSGIPFGSYKVKAVATDVCGTKGESEENIFYVVDDPVLAVKSDKVIAGYLLNWDVKNAPYIKLRDVTNTYNVINVAYGKIGTDKASVSFAPVMQSENDFKTDIYIKQQAGVKVLLAVGGPNLRIDGYGLENDLAIGGSAEKTAFVNSLKNVIDKYGFDGIDFVYGKQSLGLQSGDKDPNNPTTPNIVNIISALKELTSYYRGQGKDFWLTISPEVTQAHSALASGMNNYLGVYLPIIDGLRDVLTYVSPLYHNTGGTNALDGKGYSQGTKDFLVAMSEMLTKGFTPPGASGSFDALREDQVVLGITGSETAVAGAWVNPDDLYSALDYLVNAVSYNGTYKLIKTTGYPDIRGVSVWLINHDAPAGGGISDSAWEFFFGDPTNKLPEVTLTSNKTKDTAPGSFTFTITATDSDGTITNVDLVQGGVVLKNWPGDASGSYTYTWSDVSMGEYDVVAKVTDDKDGTGSSSIVRVIVESDVVCKHPAWVAQVYDQANMMVSHKGIDYKTKWYASPSDEPGQGGDTSPWALVANPCEIDPNAPTNSKPRIFIETPTMGQVFGPPPVANIPITADATDTDGTIAGVKFYLDGSLLGDGTNTGGSKWTYSNWNDIPAGTYQLTAEATDDAGASFMTGETEVIVEDPTAPPTGGNAPTVKVEQPLDGSSYTLPTSIMFNVTAIDSDSDLKTVELYVDDVKKKTWNASEAPFQINWPSPIAGMHTVKARAVDAKGNDAWSAVNNFEVIAATAPPDGNEAPTVSITAPTQGQQFSYANGQSGITVTADASDNDGTIDKVKIYQGDILIEEVTASPYSIVLPSLGAGSYTVKAEAFDNVGVATISSVVGFEVLAEDAPEPPTVALLSPVDQSIVIYPEAIRFEASVIIPDSRVKVSKVEYVDADLGTVFATGGTSAPYAAQFTGDPGVTYRVKALVYFDALYPNTYSPTTNSVTVQAPEVPPNNNPPTITMIYPVYEDPDNPVPVEYSAPGPVYIGVDASDPDAGDRITKVNYYNNSQLIGTVSQKLTDNCLCYHFEWRGVKPGNYRIMARAYDSFGAEAATQFIDIVVVDTGEDVPPTVEILTPRNGYSTYYENSVSVEAQAEDFDGTVAKVEFFFRDITNNGSDIKYGEMGSGSTTSDLYRSVFLAPNAGDFELYAVAHDDEGFTTNSEKVTISLTDSKPNMSPMLEIVSPVSGQSFAPPATYRIEANASDVDGMITKMEFYMGSKLLKTIEGAPVLVKDMFCPISEQLEGSYTYQVKAYDDDGAVAIQNVSVNVATQIIPPSVYILTPVNGGEFVEGEKITITAVGYDFDGEIEIMEFYADDILIATKNTTNGEELYYEWTDASIGTHRIHVNGTDNSGNTAVSDPVTIIVKEKFSNKPPMVEITSPKNGDSFRPDDVIPLEAQANDPNDYITKVIFYEGDVVIKELTSFPYRYNWRGASKGSHTIKAEAYDSFGLKAVSSPITISVSDKLAPVDCSQYKQWSNEISYQRGDRVVFANDVFECLMNGATEPPTEGIDNNWWKFIAHCSGSTGSTESVNDRGGLIVRMYPNPITGEWLKLDLDVNPGEKITIKFISMNTMQVVPNSTVETTATLIGIETFMASVRNVPPGPVQVLVTTDRDRTDNLLLNRR